MNIPEHRKAIDKLDTQIVKVLNERTKHILAIGEIKLKAGEEIYAPHRERAVLQRICRQNQGPITNESLRAIYREIMSSALSLEKSMTVAYLGPEAAFTHQAAIRRFGSSLRYSPQKTIADVFAEVSKNRADYGVVPVENSTEGGVTHTLDMFADSDLKIVSQIQDNAANATHFLVLGRQCSPPTGKDRTSLMFSIVDWVGALYRALAPFRRHRLNITKFESRPSKRKAGEYVFFVDCDGHLNDRKVANAIALLGEHCSYVKVLGSYPNSE